MRRLASPQISAAITALVIGGTVAGCGSSSSSSAPASSSSGSSTAASSGGTTSTAASTSTSGFNLAAIKQKVAGFEAGPTVYNGPTEAVKPPAAIKLAVVPCSEALAGCEESALGVQAVAKRLGWTVTLYNGDATPSGMNNAVQQAVTSGANAIITTAVNPDFIASGLAAAKAKGIPVGSATEGVAPSPGGIQFDIGTNWSTLGQAVGDYVIADSDGKAVFQPFNDKEYGSVIDFVDGAIDAVKACPTCKVMPTQEFVGAGVGPALGSRVVDLLRSNPSINYIVAGYDPAAAAMVPSIANAGLKGKVKIASSIGAAQNLAYVKAGNVQTADIGFDNQYIGYMAVYQMTRLLDKMPLWTTPGVSNPLYKYSGDVPIKLYTSSDPNFPIANYDADSTLHYVSRMQTLLGLH